MSSRHLLDPTLEPLIPMGEMLTFDDATIAGARAAFAQTAGLGDTKGTNVTREEVHLASADGYNVRCLVYKPNNSKGQRSGYVHIHGGGYIIGSADMADEGNLRIASELDCVVISVDYRLAPEYPIPKPLDDCYAALAWIHNEADALNVDKQRIGTGGESAGGGLAAALALKARDAGDYALCHQQLTYPMLDDRTGTDEAPGDPLVGEFVWTRESNRYGWSRFLGDAAKAAPQVPARAETLKGLPPTWIMTGGLDLFRDEDITYAQRLMNDGVLTELVVIPGACHGFQGIPGSALNERYQHEFTVALRNGLAG